MKSRLDITGQQQCLALKDLKDMTAKKNRELIRDCISIFEEEKNRKRPELSSAKLRGR